MGMMKTLVYCSFLLASVLLGSALDQDAAVNLTTISLDRGNASGTEERGVIKISAEDILIVAHNGTEAEEVPAVILPDEGDRSVHIMKSAKVLTEDVPKEPLSRSFAPGRKPATGIKSSDWDGEETGRGNATRLEVLFDLYSVHRLAALWTNQTSRDITTQCVRHMETYFQQLDKATLWALKMDDASGRYSSGFFWGNAYWLGSASLCEEIGLDYFGAGTPPFTIGFYNIRVDLDLPQQIAQYGHRVHVGLCLPMACTADDVQKILELSSRDEDGKMPRHFHISNVRSPHNNYNMWQDPVMWIIIGVTVVVFTIIGFGTMYDLYLYHKSSMFSANYTYEISKASGNKQQGDLDIENLSHTNSNNNILHGAVKSCTDALPVDFTRSPYAESENTISSSTEESDKPGILSQVLLSFSLRLNLLAICDQSVGVDTIPTIHGLRSMSMAWVILGHTCIVAFKYSDNTAYRSVVEKEFLFQTISNGAFSVDTFFFISGLLVSFLYFRTMAKVDISKLTFQTTGLKSSVLQFLGLLGYRFCRLTVPYLFVLGVVQICMKWFYFNSVFEPPTLDHINCPNYWWRNVLYINTLFPVQEMCMLWSWYLADDTQFFILGAILLILAISHFRLSAVLMVIFLVSSWCTTAFISYSNDHVPSVDDPLALFDKIYDKPWTRLGPYLVGMSVGWFLFKTDCSIKMNKLVVTVGWLFSTACIMSLVYGLYETTLHPIAGAAYSALSHTAWALGLSWIVIACSTGYGGYVNDLLSASILYPFSRVTYCAYLVHPIMIRVMAMKLDSPLHLSSNTVMILFFGQVVASYILSFVLSLTFEAPVVQLLKILSPTKRKKTQ